MKQLSNHKIKLLLILGPSGAFLIIYFLISVLFVNTTDRHLLTTNREMRQYHAGSYHRLINYFHEKMLFVKDKKKRHHIIHLVPADSTSIHVMKQTSQVKH